MRRRSRRLRTTILALVAGAALVTACLGLGGLLGVALGVAAGAAALSAAYAASGRLALRAMLARQVGEVDLPELTRIVRELATTLRQPMPAVFVSPVRTPNAFTVGRGPRRAAICVTVGLLELLDPRELRAVVAHELAHVANRDVLVTSVASTLAGMIVAVAQGAWRLSARRTRGRPRLGVLLLAVLAPVAATVLRLAVHRSREYDADLVACRVTGDPLALARALRLIEHGTARAPLPAEPELRATAALMIADPFGGGGLSWLFSTHPPTADRVAWLERLGGRRQG